MTIHSPRRIACANERTTALDTGRFLVFAASHCEARSGVIVCTLLRTQTTLCCLIHRTGRPPQPTRHDRTHHPVTGNPTSHPRPGSHRRRPTGSGHHHDVPAGSTTPGHGDVVRLGSRPLDSAPPSASRRRPADIVSLTDTVSNRRPERRRMKLRRSGVIDSQLRLNPGHRSSRHRPATRAHRPNIRLNA